MNPAGELMHINENASGIVTAVVFICSIFHSLLPPWETFNDFPRFQPCYKVFVMIVGYVALNARSTVHPSIKPKNGDDPRKQGR